MASLSGGLNHNLRLTFSYHRFSWGRKDHVVPSCFEGIIKPPRAKFSPSLLIALENPQRHRSSCRGCHSEDLHYCVDLCVSVKFSDFML